MKKIAFLISAHHEKGHLEKLLKKLDHVGCQSFVHWDQKSGPLPADMPAVFCRRRYNVLWGGFSQVKATLELFRTALSHGEFDYFCLLSGVDYPVRPISQLQDFLSEVPVDYINVTEFGRMGKSIERILCPHMEGAIRCVGLVPILKRIANAAMRVCYRRFGYTRRLPRGFKIEDFRAGSNWFCLRASTVQIILEELNRNYDFLRFCEATLCPDEFFFQTLINKFVNDGMQRPNFHYADWEKGDPPYPSILDERHLPELLEARIAADGYGPERPCFFARKFSDESGTLIEEIDAQKP